MTTKQEEVIVDITLVTLLFNDNIIWQARLERLDGGARTL